MVGLGIVVAAVIVAVAFGGYRALTDGRFRGTHEVKGARPAVEARGAQAPVVEVDGAPGPVVEVRGTSLETTASAEPTLTTTWAALGKAVATVRPGERATLVQFSSAFCAPCRATKRILGDIAGVVPGVVHVEIDAEHHLEVVRRLGILRTPTTLILDGSGQEISRAAGAPRKEQVLSALP